VYRPTAWTAVGPIYFKNKTLYCHLDYISCLSSSNVWSVYS